MTIRSTSRKRTLLSEENGSYTIESALLLPVAVVVVVGILFLTVVSAQTSLVYVAADESANRVASHWNNSNKHPATGMYSLLQSDPLYWRWNFEGASAWFGLGGRQQADTIALPGEPAEAATPAQSKLAGASYGWPSAYRGSGTLDSAGWLSSVTVEAGVPISAPGGLGLPRSTAGRSTEVVAEPAEYIRNIELILGYIPAIASEINTGTIRNTLSPWLDKATPVIGADRSLTFRHHAEAVVYARALVRGQETRISTEINGKWRLIDALDKYNVAHQTYIGAKRPTKDVMDQLAKDAELIRAGKVNGVVWHFFRRTGEADSGPSPELKRILQEQGIVIVVHS